MIVEGGREGITHHTFVSADESLLRKDGVHYAHNPDRLVSSRSLLQVYNSPAQLTCNHKTRHRDFGRRRRKKRKTGQLWPSARDSGVIASLFHEHPPQNVS